MGLKQKTALLAAALTTLVSALAAGLIVGREVRTVELVALFAGGFCAGALVTAALVAMRSSRAGTSTGSQAAVGDSPTDGA